MQTHLKSLFARCAVPTPPTAIFGTILTKGRGCYGWMGATGADGHIRRVDRAGAAYDFTTGAVSCKVAQGWGQCSVLRTACNRCGRHHSRSTGPHWPRTSYTIALELRSRTSAGTAATCCTTSSTEAAKARRRGVARLCAVGFLLLQCFEIDDHKPAGGFHAQWRAAQHAVLKAAHTCACVCVRAHPPMQHPSQQQQMHHTSRPNKTKNPSRYLTKNGLRDGARLLSPVAFCTGCT